MDELVIPASVDMEPRDMRGKIEEALVAGLNSKATIGEMAIKILAAMREPTPDMIAIAESYADFVLPDCFDNSVEGRQAEMRMAWQKAIDVALYGGVGRNPNQ